MEKIPKNRITNLILALFTCIFSLFLLELAFRIYEGKVFHHKNLIEDFQKNRRGPKNYPTVFDPSLGWIPKPHIQSSSKDGTVRITILHDGLRSNGHSLPQGRDKPAILVVGDSFTFGEEVTDFETWPALLEKTLGLKVFNGGVAGFGMDQIVLRGEILSRKLRPHLLILSFILQDLYRCELSLFDHTPKPFFKIENQKILYVPIPSIPGKRHGNIKSQGLNGVQRYLGYSFLADFLMKRWDTRAWYGKDLKIEHKEGERVSCLLMERLGKWATQEKISVLVMAQYGLDIHPKHSQVSEKVLQCAKKNGIKTLNLYSTIFPLKNLGKFYWKPLGHMTGKGNQVIAETLARAILKAFPSLP